MSEPTDPWVSALLAERAGYVRRALPARVAAVDEQLALRGYDTSVLPGVDSGDPTSTPPKGRRRPTKEQT